MAIATRLATIHNYKDELSGEARERREARQSSSCNPINSTEIQCAVFLTHAAIGLILAKPRLGFGLVWTRICDLLHTSNNYRAVNLAHNHVVPVLTTYLQHAP